MAPQTRSDMTRAEFERLVVETIMLIPKGFRREMKNLALVIEEEPSSELLEGMEIEEHYWRGGTLGNDETDEDDAGAAAERRGTGGG